MLCDDLEGWNGGGGGRETQEGGDLCVHTVDSHCCTAEANTTLESSYTPKKKKIKNKHNPLLFRQILKASFHVQSPKP